MKTLCFVFLAASLMAQGPVTKDLAPSLSTADKVAIKSLEDRKNDASKTWNEANDQELSILREWGANHPGFHVHYTPGPDPKNFTIEADKPEVKK